MPHTTADQIAQELDVRPAQVNAAIDLIDNGATIPFIARYRKEATGTLDETQLRTLSERLNTLRDLAARRETVLRSIQEQGKLSQVLQQAIARATTRTELEDLYLPFRPKRRTRAQRAREAGLEPLAERLFNDPSTDPDVVASQYINAENEIKNTADALDGARDILAETLAEDANLAGALRQKLWLRGTLHAQVISGQEQEGAKFHDYFDYSENIKNIPSHRALALFRGQELGVLKLSLHFPQAENPEQDIARHHGIDEGTSSRAIWLNNVVRWTWRVKLQGRLEVDIKARLREIAESEAIRVFGRNLHDLLMAPPAGSKVVMGLDPGLRTGTKVAVVNATGQVVATATIYPHAPQRKWQAALDTLLALTHKHGVALIAVGNGTASRETQTLAAELVAASKKTLTQVTVSEAGASVYSASPLAVAELPELDVTLRGAVSIARRLQDPLAELVKIDPKAIGVGQYQHDVDQSLLSRRLDDIVESCVNTVGVDLNTASGALLQHVAGLSANLAKNIVDLRDQNGPFQSRNALLKVPRLGPRTYQQCAGFLRIANAKHPLDSSAVHPEAYPLAARIAQHHGLSIDALIGNERVLQKTNAADFVDQTFGLPTVNDVLNEMRKPGRDPRPDFQTARFDPEVQHLKDLQKDQSLEGVITNVTNFGAFVDIGVHQDGLVHISELADRFVKDPHEFVKAGQIVQVRVLDIDLKLRRIALSMRTQLADTDKPPTAKKATKVPPSPKAAQNSAFADAFSRAKSRR